jgi:hypothetical protein
VPVNGTAYVKGQVSYLFWHMDFVHVRKFEVLALLGCWAAYVAICLTDVSGQPIGPILKCEAVLDYLTFEDEAVPKRR